MNTRYLLFTYLICILSIIGGLWNSQFINDGYHWGFIYSNSLDLIHGKKPYNEIFLEYGLLQSLINLIIIKFINNSVYSIQAFTVLIYAFSLFILNRVILNITSNHRLSFFSVLIIFLINPWSYSPWPIYLVFFFSLLFIFFYLKESKKDSIIAGLFLFFAYLSYSTIFNFTFILFILLFFFKFYLLKFNKISTNKTNNYFFLITFVFLFLVFLVYLNLNGIFFEWIKFQTIPFLIKDSLNYSFIDLVKEYTYFIFFEPIFKMVYEPQWLIYSILFIFNILSINLFIKKIFTKNITNKEIKIFSIILFIFTLNFFGQVKTLMYLSCSLSMGIISFAIIYNKMKNTEDKIIIIFIFTFLTIFSLFNFDMKFSKNADGRFKSVKFLMDKENKIINNDFKYFKYFKWDKNYWKFLKNHNDKINVIKDNCDNIEGVNLTDDTFLYILIGKQTFQKIPFFLDSSAHELNNIFDSTLKNEIQIKLNHDSIFLISHKNNEENFNFSNNYETKKIYKKTSKTIAEEFRLIFPKKCN